MRTALILVAALVFAGCDIAPIEATDLLSDTRVLQALPSRFTDCMINSRESVNDAEETYRYSGAVRVEQPWGDFAEAADAVLNVDFKSNGYVSLPILIQGTDWRTDDFARIENGNMTVRNGSGVIRGDGVTGLFTFESMRPNVTEPWWSITGSFSCAL